jgi:anti-sigma factor RsiW
MIALSDEVLMAYADGQLDQPQSAVVGRMLRDDQELAIRVSRLQQTQAQLLDTFGALLREGGSSHARPARAQRASSASPLSGAGVLTAGVAAGLFLIGACAGVTGAYYSGMLTGETREVEHLLPTNWPGDIAEFHSFFTADALRVSPESQSNREMVKFQLSQLFTGAPMPDFSEQGLHFAHGQILSYRGNKVMQLYIGAGGLDMPMSPGRFGDVNTISWSANEFRFILASTMPHQSLRALAVVANSQLGGK